MKTRKKKTVKGEEVNPNSSPVCYMESKDLRAEYQVESVSIPKKKPK